jgi:hypothetical protein
MRKTCGELSRSFAAAHPPIGACANLTSRYLQAERNLRPGIHDRNWSFLRFPRGQAIRNLVSYIFVTTRGGNLPVRFYRAASGGSPRPISNTPPRWAQRTRNTRGYFQSEGIYLKMSKKILTALAPVAAIVVFTALPALAQATQAQCGAAECPVLFELRFQSSNLQMQIQTGEKDEGAISCASTTFEGTLNNQSSTLPGKILFGSQAGCTAKGVSTDIKSNLSAEPLGWRWSIQQPEADGQVTAHITPDPAGTIRFTSQVQIFGASVATCVFEATSIQLMGNEHSDTLAIEGSNQFTLIERSGIAASECGTVGTTKGDLTGSFQLETKSGAAVVVHMS